MLLYHAKDGILKEIRKIHPEIIDEMVTENVYVTVGQQRNATWSLSQKVILEQGEGGVSAVKVYYNKEEQTVTGADIAIVVVDKDDGKLVNIGRFNY